MAPMSISDATVALRSLPRRYREVVSGPVGDDAWDRLVRAVGDHPRSALGWTVYANQLITALGTAILELPLKARPSIDLAKLHRSRVEAPRATTVEEVTAELTASVDRAAQAIASRSHEAFEREVLVDGKPIAARLVVDRIVRDAVGHIKHAEAALQAARDSI